jgi:hypothetical protein
LDDRAELTVLLVDVHPLFVTYVFQAPDAIVWLDRKLAASAVNQGKQLDVRGPAVVEQGIQGGSNGSPGVQNVVYE